MSHNFSNNRIVECHDTKEIFNSAGCLIILAHPDIITADKDYGANMAPGGYVFVKNCYITDKTPFRTYIHTFTYIISADKRSRNQNINKFINSMKQNKL